MEIVLRQIDINSFLSAYLLSFIVEYFKSMPIQDLKRIVVLSLLNPLAAWEESLDHQVATKKRLSYEPLSASFDVACAYPYYLIHP